MKARNVAIAKSKGSYIAPIDADDIWFPEKIEKQMQCLLNSSPSVGLVYCWSVDINAREEIIGRYCADVYQTVHSTNGYVLPVLAYSNFLNNGSNPLIRRICLTSVGNYDYRLREQNAEGCEDLDLYLRIAEQYEFQVVPEFLMGYRQSAGSLSRNSMRIAKSYNLTMAKLKSRHPEIPRYFYRWSRGYFYNYLVGQVFGSGNNRDAIYWVYKAFRVDWAIVLRPGIYKVLLLSSLRIIVELIASLTGQNHKIWSEFRDRSFLAPKSYRNIAEIKQQWQKSSSFKDSLYDRLLSYRWHQVNKFCQGDSCKRANRYWDEDKFAR
ncbi:MAG: glycosyltransferase [Cyanobacteria bacterium J06600_6]